MHGGWGPGWINTAIWSHRQNKNVFCDLLKRLSEVGRQIVPETQGPATMKALSPKLVRVRLARSVRVSAERSLLGRASVTRQQSSVRQLGACLVNARWTRTATLNPTRCRTGGQCSWRRTGEMRSHRRVPSTTERQRSGSTGGDVSDRRWCRSTVQSLLTVTVGNAP